MKQTKPKIDIQFYCGAMIMGLKKSVQRTKLLEAKQHSHFPLCECERVFMCVCIA